MIAPHPKHRLAPNHRPASPSSSSVATDPAVSTDRARRARRAAAALLFGPSGEEEDRPSTKHSPWAVITVWLLTIWMLVAVAYHFSWMFSTLKRTF